MKYCLKMVFATIAFIFCLDSSARIVMAQAPPPSATQAADGFAFNEQEEQFKSKFDGSMQSYLIADLRSDAAKDKPPLLVVYLHGHGSKAKKAFSLNLFFDSFGRMGRWMKAHDAIYICPEYRGNSWMGPAAEADVLQIIEMAKEKYKPSRFILTGGSMGGTSALIFASLHPEAQDAVLAWCPATDPVPMRKQFGKAIDAAYGGTPETVPQVFKDRTSRDHAAALAKLPVVIIHGHADTIIPFEHSQIIVDRIKAEKGNVKFVEVEGGHDAPFKADVAGLLDWLLAQTEKK